MMSVTNIGVSSTHWQYSTNMLTSNKTVLQNKQTKTVDLLAEKENPLFKSFSSLNLPNNSKSLSIYN